MGYSVRTSEFGKMSEKDKARAVSELARRAFESNGQAGQIDEFERRYGFDSRQLLQALTEGRLSETDEIADWLWLLNFRSNRVS